MPSSRGSSQRMEPASLMSPSLAGGFFTTSTTRGALHLHSLRLIKGLLLHWRTKAASHVEHSAYWSSRHHSPWVCRAHPHQEGAIWTARMHPEKEKLGQTLSFRDWKISY